MWPDSLVSLNTALRGRYVVERKLGAGGMATVYLATDVKHQRQVALKILHPELAAMLGPTRFLREIRIAAQLTHPNILPLYDSGELTDWRPGNEGAPALFYVMPFVKGESLRQRLLRETQLPIDDAIRLTRQVASALEFAHAHGVVHRDIKPENILLHEGQAMLADFGVATAPSGASGERLTTPGVVVGTPAYMSPEQAVGDATLDARSDIYSLACVLYEMLTGEPPYTGPTAVAVVMKRLTDPIPSAQRLRPAVPAAVEQALATALARAPLDRFPSVAAFADRLVMPTLPRAPRPRSVAVLPFISLSADPDNEFFADGLTEDIIAHLTKVRAIDVISRTSVTSFRKREQSLREIGERLNVATLLDGSVRRAGDRVRIVAQLIDVTTDRQLWAETYDRRLDDIFAIQTDVALQIVSSLRAELSPDERTRIGAPPTRNIEAYRYYLQGRQDFQRYTREGFLGSIELYRRALERDPDFAHALAAMAQSYVELGETGALDTRVAFARARDALTRALSTGADVGDVHASYGYFRFVAEFDWAGAEASFRRALELSPGNVDAMDYYGRMLGAVERYDEAIAVLLRARDLDPLVVRTDPATAMLRAGRAQEAVDALRPVVELDPRYARARAALGWAYLKLGTREEGLAELEAAVALAPGDSLWLAQLGQAYALEGRTDQAREILERLQETARERFVSPYHLAYVLTGLGEADAAIDLLERAYEQRTGAIYGIKGSFLFHPLRGHPRFQALLAKMNLT